MRATAYHCLHGKGFQVSWTGETFRFMTMISGANPGILGLMTINSGEVPD